MTKKFLISNSSTSAWVNLLQRSYAGIQPVLTDGDYDIQVYANRLNQLIAFMLESSEIGRRLVELVVPTIASNAIAKDYDN